MATFEFSPGALNTTLDRSAVGQQAASFVRNCETGRGVWHVDKRYRRIQIPPLRTWFTGDDEDICGSVFAPSGVTPVARAGQTDTFTNRGQAIVEDGLFATASPLRPGDITEGLRFALPPPPETIPPSATDVKLTVRVKRNVDPDTGVPTPMVDDLVRLRREGGDYGPNFATEDEVPQDNLWRDYTFDMSGLGLLPSELNAGQIDGIDLGWKAVPGNLADFNPASWQIQFTPAMPEENVGDPMSEGVDSEAEVSGPVTIQITRIAGASGYVVLNLAGEATGTAYLDPNIGIFTFIGFATATSGFGQTESGAIRMPPGPPPLLPILRRAVGGATVRVDVDELGEGSLAITPSATSVIGIHPDAGEGAMSALATRDLTASVVPPDPTTLNVDAVLAQYCYSVSTGEFTVLSGAQGIGYGDFGGTDEFQAVWGEGAFTVPAQAVESGMGDDWSVELSGRRLGPLPYVQWQFGKWLYATNEIFGTWSREIGTQIWRPLLADTQSPGDTGDGNIDQLVPPYISHHTFDGVGGDAITVIGQQTGGTFTADLNGPNGEARVVSPDYGSGRFRKWFEFEIELAAYRDFSQGNVVTWKWGQYTDGFISEPGNDGFTNNLPNRQWIEFEDSAGVTARFPAALAGILEVKDGSGYWAAQTRGPGTIDNGIDWTAIRFVRFGVATFQTGKTTLMLDYFYSGGFIYHDLSATPFHQQTPSNTSPLQYAYYYSEGAVESPARTMTLSALTHLGLARPGAGLPGGDLGSFGGSQSEVTVPVADSPFTGAATIHLIRQVNGSWRTLATGPNSADLVFDDDLPDSEIEADPVTYPVVTPGFDVDQPIIAGQVFGIVTGCSWKGSNVYAGTDGKIYFSRTNYPEEVLWKGVVLTNDVGSADLGPPRTSTLADNTSDYALALVPCENLYCFTVRDAYVFVSGDTAATASFPRRIDGVRGVVGRRAACVMGDRALVGSQDGLWAVKKSNTAGEQPDELIEVTKEVRGSWQWLIGSAPERTVVRHWLGEIWCFCEGRILHLTPEGHWIEGVWADGRTVEDAVADPRRGIVMQMADGHLGLVGRFITDGGTNLAGDDGVPVRWIWRSGKIPEAQRIERTVMRIESSAPQGCDVMVRAVAKQGSDALAFAGYSDYVVNDAFRRLPDDGRLGGGWFIGEIEGAAQDRVITWEFEIVPRGETRGEWGKN